MCSRFRTSTDSQINDTDRSIDKLSFPPFTCAIQIQLTNWTKQYFDEFLNETINNENGKFMFYLVEMNDLKKMIFFLSLFDQTEKWKPKINLAVVIAWW